MGRNPNSKASQDYNKKDLPDFMLQRRIEDNHGERPINKDNINTVYFQREVESQNAPVLKTE